MAESVWEPRDAAPAEPLEMLIRAVRQMIAFVQSESQAGNAFSKTLSLDLAEWGNPSEVTVRCAMSRQASHGGRPALEYLFSGSLTGGGQYRRFSGQGVLDIDTGALLAMEFDTGSPIKG